jgi:hypothetical protein
MPISRRCAALRVRTLSRLEPAHGARVASTPARMIARMIGLSLAVCSCAGGGSPPLSEPAPGAACVTGLTGDCRPLYDPPTFDALYSNVFHATCAQGKGTCHTADAAMAGLVFEDPDRAYSLLLGETGRQRVIPGDPGCSLLMRRLESADPNFRMPPGPTPLLDSELCTITQWILQGAAR